MPGAPADSFRVAFVQTVVDIQDLVDDFSDSALNCEQEDKADVAAAYRECARKLRRMAAGETGREAGGG